MCIVNQASSLPLLDAGMLPSFPFRFSNWCAELFATFDILLSWLAASAIPIWESCPLLFNALSQTIHAFCLFIHVKLLNLLAPFVTLVWPLTLPLQLHSSSVAFMSK